MKKRILGLALALVMIISLLPLTAMAEDLPPMPKVTVKGNDNVSVHSGGITGTNVLYLTFEPIEGGTNVVKVTEEPADNYMKFFYNKSENVLEILFKNVDYRPVTAATTFLAIAKNTGGNGYSNAYDIVLTLEGENNIIAQSGANIISVTNNGSMTITGPGSLKMSSNIGDGANINKTVGGELIILNTKLHLENTYDKASTAVIVNNGSVTIENSEVTLVSARNRGIVTSDKYKNTPSDTTHVVTVKKGSTLICDCEGSAYQIQTAGSIVFDNSNVILDRGEGNHSGVFNKAPTIIGNYSEVLYKSLEKNDYKNYSELGLNPGDSITTDHSLRHFKLTHQCKVEADDGDCTTAVACACGKEAAAAKQHAGVITDCTKDTMCTNAGCTKVFEAKKGDDHVAGADDGDCTTAVKCANCEQIVTQAAAKHVWDRANCSVDGACTTPGCTQTVTAGTHTGGTATCKDKAKCAECGEEYGELGACAPKADDGDCTTDIKCSVCDKTTTAGQAAHKYTDKNDTTCDNAGCTNTRKVEGTENPKTGDNSAIAVVAALMVTAAAAFVTTKKFAR